MNLLQVLTRRFSTTRLFSSTACLCNDVVVETKDLTREEIWRRRRQFSTPTIQRFEKPVSKIYYAPEWEIKKNPVKNEEYNPKKHCITTPDKWEYHNKIVWPAGHVVPETGLPKPAEVFHCEESFHFSVKKMWFACQFVQRMQVDEALLQLKFKNNKACLILTSVIEKAMERASKEFHIDDPSKMFVAEAFSIQHRIIKSMKRHARERWQKTRHRFINVYVRLEEGVAPNYKGRQPLKNGWEHMDAYYDYLRNREIKLLT